MNTNIWRQRSKPAQFVCTIGILPLLAAGLPSHAADFEEVSETLASDADPSGFYGHAVAIDGNTAVVGANEHDHGGANTGGAYVVTRKADGTWSQAAELDPGVRAAEDLFGYSVAISGDTAVIGATDTGDFGVSSGSAYVFVNSGNDDWVMQKELHAGNAQINHRFGIASAISGDTAIVTSSKNSGAFAESGAAYVFVRDAANDWSEPIKLEPSDPGFFAHFGSAVAIDGDTAVIGAKDDGQNGFQAGAAYVFVRDAGGTWSQQAKLMAPVATVRDQFGASVAISGDTVVIGAQTADLGGDESGSAYIFTRDVNGTWLPPMRFDGVTADQFGASVGLSGTKAIVGAFGRLPLGAARVFSRDLNGMWSEQANVLGPQAGISGSLFGFSVAISGNRAVVGHKFRNDNLNIGPLIGSAHFFEAASAEIQIQAVVANVVSLNLNTGIENSLDGKLNAALQALDDANSNNDQAAINSMIAFKNFVLAQSGNMIDAADAEELITAADEIIALLSSI